MVTKEKRKAKMGPAMKTKCVGQNKNILLTVYTLCWSALEDDFRTFLLCFEEHQAANFAHF
jgi:hypothetical protein